MTTYADFLRAKIKLDPIHGVDIDPARLNPALKPFTRASVQWLLRGGRRALFSSFGLHKTVTQLEVMRLAPVKVPRLIVAPLNVRQEFLADAAQYFTGEHVIDVRFVQRTAEIDDDRPIWLTNYESVREGKLDPAGFCISLDEASILRGFGGTKTFREFMRLFEHAEGYRFVATATPSPNEYIELLAYAAFLGIMDVGQAKTRFFKRNSEKADELTLRPGAEREFWLWVGSWSLWVSKPSDLGFSDDGYELPPLDVRWHEVPTDHSGAGAECDGQVRMFKNSSVGVSEAAREKRDSLRGRVEKLLELRAEDPGAHRVIWHHLEDERRAIERACPMVTSVYGSQDLDERDRAIGDFKSGHIQELAAKPVMLGSGCNFQRHCAWAIFIGIDDKFNDLIQAIYRLQRFGQPRPVRIDIIYTSAERERRRRIERRWRQHDEQRARMAEIVREYGLSAAAMAETLQRTIGVQREEVAGEGWRLVLNDCVDEVATMAVDSVDLVVTSIPFGTQYEYTPSYNDFGHTEDDQHFFRQMDFLLPGLLRALKPGRVAAIHVKDRIVPGGINGLGFQTVSAFSDKTRAAFEAAGFAYLSRITIPTDVVRENNQTYRLGWTEQCKDGTRMGNGMPEYLLVFRKPQTDRTRGFADRPVRKEKPQVYADGTDGQTTPFAKNRRPVPGTGYSRGRWQLDAHSLRPTDGETLPRVLPKELADVIRAARSDPDQKKHPIYRAWKKWSIEHRYSFDLHVAFAEELDRYGLLPPDFMLIPPHSDHPEIWTDIARMRSLNMIQQQKGRDQHLCPLPFDIVDRCIVQYSEPGELVLDPFGGIGTVGYCAIKQRRRAYLVELSRSYWSDARYHLVDAERSMATPSLFDLPDDREAA